jgi:hypothetical protein
MVVGMRGRKAETMDDRWCESGHWADGEMRVWEDEEGGEECKDENKIDSPCDHSLSMFTPLSRIQGRTS